MKLSHFLLHSKILSGQELHFESLTKFKNLYVSILYIWHCCMILNYSYQIASGYKKKFQLLHSCDNIYFPIYFNKLIVPNNTFRFRRLGRKILSKVDPPMEKLIVKCGIYFVFLNILITPKQKTSTIILE